MSILTRWFSKNADEVQEDKPITFEDKFDELKKILGAVGKQMPERYSASCPYICGFGESYERGRKKTIMTRKNSIHLRYYDCELSDWSGLAVLEIDRTNERFVYQKLEEIDDADEAFARFLNVVEPYADRRFTRILKEKIDASDILNPKQDTDEVGLDEQVDCQDVKTSDVNASVEKPSQRDLSPIK